SGRVQPYLHRLVGERLGDVQGEQQAGHGGGEQHLLDLDRVHRVPVDQQRAARVRVAGEPERARVVAVETVVVDHGDGQAVPGLQVGDAGDDGVSGVPGDQRHVRDVDFSHVAQDDVEDGTVPVDRDQGLGHVVGVRPQPLALTCGKYHSDHGAPPV